MLRYCLAAMLAVTLPAWACEKPRQMDGFKTCANVEKAFEEGQLVHYSPDTESSQARYLADFRKTFPQIKTVFLRLQTGALSIGMADDGPSIVMTLHQRNEPRPTSSPNSCGG